uniref:Attractin-like protein 1 n=1 Tax=Trichogramma kaykai TaxID=54128 RepID=A0ABD2XI47_9HYME
MAAVQETAQTLLYLFKTSKYRRRRRKPPSTAAALLLLHLLVLGCVLQLALATSIVGFGVSSVASCDQDNCQNGQCINGSCVCHDGWQGPNCQYCASKVRLSGPSGTIHDGVGNYTTDVKCSWLIKPSRSSALLPSELGSGSPATSTSTSSPTIRMHIEEFATECGWDHLYIYDGDSVEAPLLGVFTGLMHKQDYHVRRVPEVVARSGSALLHFYSDVAYNMSGFNITYKIDACPSRNSSVECSGNGQCVYGNCTCNAFWMGEACDIEICPNECSRHGVCNREAHRCDCDSDYTGADCSQAKNQGYWERVDWTSSSSASSLPEGSASHCSVVWKDQLYVVGGESFHRAQMVYVYDFRLNVWEQPQQTSTSSKKQPLPRYGHSCVLHADKIYMYGGVIENSTVTNEIWTYDLVGRQWDNLTAHERCHHRSAMCGPIKVAGHTATLVQDRQDPDRRDKMVVIFGHSPQYGYLNTVQEFYFHTREWQIVKTYGFPVKGGYGHSAAYDAHAVEPSLIYVYGGYVSESQATQVLTNRLYAYHPNQPRTWRMLTAAPSARFFHTAAFVSDSLVLVFGGNTHNDTLHSYGARCYSADAIAYDVTCDTWKQYQMPRTLVDLSRYGHSSTIYPQREDHRGRAERSMYIFGGFDGQMLNDMLKYTPGSCDQMQNYSQCLNARVGVKCVWDKRQSVCLPISRVPANVLRTDDPHDGKYMRCLDDALPRGLTTHKELCKLLTDCSACVQTSYDCVWCGKSCAHEICRNVANAPAQHAVRHLEECSPNGGVECYQLHTCQSCSANLNCIWSWSNGPDRCKPLSDIAISAPIMPSSSSSSSSSVSSSSRSMLHVLRNDALLLSSITQQGNLSSSISSSLSSSSPGGGVSSSSSSSSSSIVPQPQARSVPGDICRSPCVDYTSCRNCTETECIWCQNEERCVDKNAYPASFPYGQCREWTTLHEKCRGSSKSSSSSSDGCGSHNSCASCREAVECGWCDDGSGTGRGKCLPGGDARPSAKSLDTCPAENWYFTSCPLCQCNGHSICEPGTSKCMECLDLTQGPHCEKCRPGYYGSPLNGASCQPCSCNDQGTNCTSETGKCFCTTKGIIGDHCERCDVSGLYHGDPTNRGSCFYDLAIDYQFTFNLSKKEDRHYRAINFKNSPPKPDVDADFSITCSVIAKMNITIKRANSMEKPLLLQANCTNLTYKHRFSKADYNFGNEDNNTLTTFYVYVYDFQPPLWIQISFSQYSKLNLQQFFITFSTCFLALLLVAAVLWKIKQKYDMYRRRQRLFVEMQQMANRAFSQVLVEIERRDTLVAENEGNNEVEVSNNTRSKKKKKKDAPSPIALEPCCGNRAAVLSLLVRLPTGSESYTPPGQSAGLAVASALVTLGTPRRPSQEITIKEPKKSRKSGSQHPESTCI